MSTMIDHFIGIDGGGTKTEGVLTDASGRVLCVKKYGASNPADVGLRGAAEVISRLILALLADGGHVPPTSVSVFAGIAGALNRREALTEPIRQDFPDIGSLTVHSDVINLLSSASPTGDGVCLICGTGSVCFARQGNRLTQVGGWGYLLDGTGSGYDIGRMALSLALKAHDGRTDATALKPLIDALTRHLGKAPHEMIPEIYERGKPFIAACAPVVFELARGGDHVAEYILDDNAYSLAECITAARKKISGDERIPVILGGSICVKEAPQWTGRIQGFLSPEIARSVLLRVSDAPPVFGALTEALRRSENDGGDARFFEYRQSFLTTYQAFCEQAERN